MSRPIILRQEELKEDIYRVINESKLDITIVQHVVAGVCADVNNAYMQALQQAKNAQAAETIKTDTVVEEDC